ncbi:glycosyltransferase [Chloroflexia bacterium SDU3-3]|nr:glycosyltransferase [Chloroflexia bacterium SDU3-3]
MHLALLSAEYPPTAGGIGDYTRQLGTALAARGHAVTIWTIVGQRFVVQGLAGEPLLALPCAGGWGWPSWRCVAQALAQTRPDALHIQYQTGAYGMHPAINFLPWRLRRTPQAPPTLVTAHDLLEPYLFPKAGPLRRYVTRRLIADADAAILTNEADLAQAQRYRPPPRRPAALIPIGSNIPTALPDGYEREAWRRQLGLADDEVLVAYFGLMGRSKGVDTLVEALALLPPHIRLLVIGGEASAPQDVAYAAEVRARIAALGLGGRVQITGQLPEHEVAAHLRAADMAALPFADGASFRRGSLLAALAHGAPVVTTAPQAAGGALRPLVEGESALLVPPDQPAPLAQAILRLAGDPALRARLAEGGRQLAAQFSWEHIAQQHEQLYQQLARREGAD